MLLWFTYEWSAGASIRQEQLISEDTIKEIDEVSHSFKDEDVNLSIIRHHFTQSGWKAIKKLVATLQKVEWLCDACRQDLSGKQVQCDSCLARMHLHCSALKQLPKTNTWFCRNCCK